MKGDSSATLTKPPNHRLFDPKRASSPVLQRRLDAQTAKATNTAPPAPVFNFSIGNEVLDFLRPPPAFAPPAPAAIPSSGQNCLLPPSCAPGKNMSLTQFCANYNLDTGILDKLSENCFKTAGALRFLTIDELKEMTFQLGEIAALHDAVERWSVPV
jgi:hypothetical protein